MTSSALEGLWARPHGQLANAAEDSCSFHLGESRPQTPSPAAITYTSVCLPRCSQAALFLMSEVPLSRFYARQSRRNRLHTPTPQSVCLVLKLAAWVRGIDPCRSVKCFRERGVFGNLLVTDPCSFQRESYANTCRHHYTSVCVPRCSQAARLGARYRSTFL